MPKRKTPDRPLIDRSGALDTAHQNDVYIMQNPRSYTGVPMDYGGPGTEYSNTPHELSQLVMSDSPFTGPDDVHVKLWGPDSDSRMPIVQIGKSGGKRRVATPFCRMPVDGGLDSDVIPLNVSSCWKRAIYKAAQRGWEDVCGVLSEMHEASAGELTEGHDWVRDDKQTEPALSHAHPNGPAPPQYRERMECRRCGKERREAGV